MNNLTPEQLSFRAGYEQGRFDAQVEAAQQEPVTNYCKECLTYNGHHEGCSHYTSPPASKPWVGLTDEEFRAIGQRFENDNGHVQAWMSFARHIQFALKEKNNG